ncbi:MAG: MFS transporter, partial [Mesorhizobium sp.]
KFTEIAAAAVAVVGIALSSIPVLMTALLMFGIISALFGPIKYGILPDHLERKELPRANAWIESATFAAILGGTIAGGVVSADGIGVAVFGPIMMILAIACWFVSRYIPRTGSAAPDLVIDRNIFRSTWRQVNGLRDDKRIWRAGLMTSWFWLIGAIVLSILPTLVKDSLGGNEMAVTVYLGVFAVSIAIGSAIAAWMSRGRIVLLPAPVGTALLVLFGLDLAWTIWSMQPSPGAETLGLFFAGQYTFRVAIDLAGMAIASAFLVVPTFAAVQAWSPEARRARVVAAVSIVNAGFMTVGGLLVAVIQATGVSLGVILFGLAAANAVAAWLMLKFLPTNAFRDFVSILFRAFHRLEVEGMDNLKRAGVAPILALNHVSFLDGPLALTLTDEE